MQQSNQNVDWKYLQERLGQQLATSLQGVVQGAAGDLQNFASAISSELVVALASGDENAVRELKAQLRLVAEFNRVRAAEGKEQFMLQLIGVVIDTAVTGLVAAGAKIGGAA